MANLAGSSAAGLKFSFRRGDQRSSYLPQPSKALGNTPAFPSLHRFAAPKMGALICVLANYCSAPRKQVIVPYDGTRYAIGTGVHRPFHSIMPIIRFVIGFPLLALGTLGAMLCVGAIKIMGASAGNYFPSFSPKAQPKHLVEASALEPGNVIVVEAALDVSDVRFGQSLIGENGLKTAAALEVTIAPKTIFIQPQQLVATRPPQ